jgi:hypothetical protein
MATPTPAAVAAPAEAPTPAAMAAPTPDAAPTPADAATELQVLAPTPEAAPTPADDPTPSTVVPLALLPIATASILRALALPSL